MLRYSIKRQFKIKMMALISKLKIINWQNSLIEVELSMEMAQ